MNLNEQNKKIIKTWFQNCLTQKQNDKSRDLELVHQPAIDFLQNQILPELYFANETSVHWGT